MTIESGQWKEILSAIDEETDLSKDNVIEKIKEKLKAADEGEYKKWDEASFNVNHLFHAVDKPDNIFLRKEDKCTLLHLSARNNLENITEALLGVEGIDVNAKNKDVWTPLNCAAKDEWTPLHCAAYDGRTEVVKILIAKGADVNAINQYGLTPLHCAAENGHKEIVDALLAKGADVHAKNKDECTSYKSISAGGATALLGTAVAVALFATGMVAVELMSVMIAAAIVTTAALAVGGITYSPVEVIVLNSLD